MSAPYDPVQDLIDLCGEDPTKRPSATAEVINEVLAKVRQERQELAAADVEAQIRKAIELQGERNKARAAFEKADAKAVKELTRIMSGLSRQKKGNAPEPDSDPHQPVEVHNRPDGENLDQQTVKVGL